jgi:methyl-accepting chemotaxis protein
MLDAVSRSQAVIEFDPDGVILTANQNFLDALGYTLAEIVGKRHSLFVDAAEAGSREYAAFWADLRSGKTQVARFRRLGKGGREVWIEASYNPIRDRTGRVAKVVKFAIDVTERQNVAADMKGQVEAIARSQAVISFDLSGTILDANPVFLGVMGYSLAEVVGRHHQIFVPREEAASPEYRAFWARLAKGEFQAGRFRRIAKDGRDVWIEGAYNPILDAAGRPMKVVKYAQDVTEQVRLLDSLKVLIDENFAEITNAVDRSDSLAQSAGRAAGETSATVQTVAASSEELAASVQEISRSMNRSRQTADDAFERVERAGAATKRLVEASEAMNGIVGMIQDIAGQINLLALNATIEAARAGEAGKGFAVVAHEVKNLANQAARATDQITREIEGIQGVSDEVNDTLGEIRSAIDGVRDYVTSTAAAVDEQSAVTESLSATMQGGAAAVELITTNIQDIVAALAQVVQAVDKTQTAAQVLAR